MGGLQATTCGDACRAVGDSCQSFSFNTAHSECRLFNQHTCCTTYGALCPIVPAVYMLYNTVI